MLHYLVLSSSYKNEWYIDHIICIEPTSDKEAFGSFMRGFLEKNDMTDESDQTYNIDTAIRTIIKIFIEDFVTTGEYGACDFVTDSSEDYLYPIKINVFSQADKWESTKILNIRTSHKHIIYNLFY